MPAPSRQAPDSVEARIADVGRDLARSFSGVLSALPGAPHRPQWLARSLGVNTVLTSRLLKASQQRDPLVVAHTMPGPEPLRRVLLRAEKKKIDPAVIQQARAAVDRFEHLIDSEAGDRSALDAIISGWLPDARQRVELIAKQSVFRGVSQLLGMTTQTEHITAVLCPSAVSPGRADQAWLSVTRGLRRVRPGLPVTYDTTRPGSAMLTLSGEQLDHPHGLLLERFCSKPLPSLKVSILPDRAQFTIVDDRVGVQSAVDLAHATFMPANKAMHRQPGEAPRVVTIAMGIARPSKVFIFDVLLHPDVYPGQQPTLHLYRASPYGPANPNDKSRDVDRIDVLESVQPMGRGIGKFRTHDNPDYLDMLQLVCSQRAWDPEVLRGYRCRVEYAMYSSEVVLSFDLPEAP